MEILFKNGIPGFEECRNFIINDINENENLKMITSKENSNIGFVAISPFDVRNDYEIDLNDEITEELEIKDHKDVLVLNLITLGQTLETSTVNLKAPVIININNNKGKQLILQCDKYQIKEPLK